jgi:hypothetical protein
VSCPVGAGTRVQCSQSLLLLLHDPRNVETVNFRSVRHPAFLLGGGRRSTAGLRTSSTCTPVSIRTDSVRKGQARTVCTGT